MRLTLREAMALSLIALPNLISALPVNTGANLEQLIPLASIAGVDKRATGELETLVPITHMERDLEKLIPFPPSTSKRDLEQLVPLTSWSLHRGKRSMEDVELLVPVVPRDLEVLVPVAPSTSDRVHLEERKTIRPIDQSDPGSVAPDAISSVEKRKTIPPADQLGPGSVSPDNLQNNNNNKRQEYVHTKTVIETVMETITGGIAIPGYPATALSQITSEHFSTITHLPSTVTAVVTANTSSTVDTTCTDSTTSTGIRSASTRISSSIANLSSSAKAGAVTTIPTGVKTGVSTAPSISNGGTRTKESVKTSATVTNEFKPSGTAAFGTGKYGAHPSGAGTGTFHLSSTGDVMSKNTITSSKPIASASASGDITTIIKSSTTKIYTTVNANNESGSGTMKASSGTSTKTTNVGTSTNTSVIGAKPTDVKSSSGGVKNISTSTVSALSSISTSGMVRSKTTSSVEVTGTPATSTKVEDTATAVADPAITSKIVYTGVQKVYPFSV